MNQQNKTRRWGKDFDKLWELHTSKGSDMYEKYDKKMFVAFICQLLSDARREEREQVIGEIEKEY